MQKVMKRATSVSAELKSSEEYVTQVPWWCGGLPGQTPPLYIVDYSDQ